MKTISFFVTGTPIAQPRVKSRAFPLEYKDGRPVIKNGRQIWSSSVYTPPVAEGWKSQVAMAARQYVPDQPFTGPLQVDCTFYLPRPTTHYGSGKNAGKLKDSAPKYCETKPDLDNAIKCVWDVCSQLRIWLDDRQIVKSCSEKLYEVPGSITPGVQVVIVPLDNKSDTSEARKVFGEFGTEKQPVFESLV